MVSPGRADHFCDSVHIVCICPLHSRVSLLTHNVRRRRLMSPFLAHRRQCNTVPRKNSGSWGGSLFQISATPVPGTPPIPPPLNH
jgi:hypothetical protein